MLSRDGGAGSTRDVANYHLHPITSFPLFHWQREYQCLHLGQDNETSGFLTRIMKRGLVRSVSWELGDQAKFIFKHCRS